MAKLDTGYLFTLIHSLSKGEKRHFKLYSTQHVLGSGNVYFRLFDEIEKQKVYEENKIRQQKIFKDLPTLKKRLYKAILKSLTDYHSGIGIRIRTMISYIEVLFNKSLFSHCTRQIRKAKKITKKYELYEEWLEVLKWEYKIAVNRADERRLILEEEKKVLVLLNNQKIYRDLANTFLESYRGFTASRNSRDLQRMKKILSSPFLKKEERALSLSAKQNFYDCHSLLAGCTGKYEESYRANKKIIDLYGAQPDMALSNPSSYLLRINNFLLACTGAGKYEEILMYIPKLENLRNSLKISAEQTTAFFYLYHLLNYYICTGQYGESTEDVKRIEQELPVHDSHLNPIQKITLYTIIAQIYFGLENYKRCLFWLNKIMLSGDMKLSLDIECYIRLFHLITHFEAKSDPELMNSLLRSAYRHLEKRDRNYDFEFAVLNLFRHHLLTGKPPKNQKEPFLVLKKKLLQLADSPSGQEALNYFDFISWVKSKIEGRTFAETVREKSRKITGSD